ncbi:MAG: InlB B-repeat-containing protein [Oscillospiraceae bacterium]|jgi:uncharacterized repeat protein (TIGR02543 family)/LPXTG-motif cell wall-anchored protein
MNRKKHLLRIASAVLIAVIAAAALIISPGTANEASAYSSYPILTVNGGQSFELKKVWLYGVPIEDEITLTVQGYYYVLSSTENTSFGIGNAAYDKTLACPDPDGDISVTYTPDAYSIAGSGEYLYSYFISFQVTLSTSEDFSRTISLPSAGPEALGIGSEETNSFEGDSSGQYQYKIMSLTESDSDGTDYTDRFAANAIYENGVHGIEVTNFIDTLSDYVTVYKVWGDEAETNPTSLEPSEITLELYKDGEEVGYIDIPVVENSWYNDYFTVSATNVTDSMALNGSPEVWKITIQGVSSEGLTIKESDDSGYIYEVTEQVDTDNSTYFKVNNVDEASTLTYDPNGGEGDQITERGAKGRTVSAADNSFSRDGYTFTEWNTEADGTGVSYTPGTEFTVDEDMTLYAAWAENYTLSYYPNGGSGSMDSYTAAAGTSVTVSENEFARTGYDFTGWNTSADGTGTSYEAGSSIVLNEDISLYAQWESETQVFTLSYDANGGEGTMDSESAESGSSVVIDENAFSRSGYSFSGWNTAADGTGTSYEAGSSIILDEDVTLYAQWTADPADEGGVPRTGDEGPGLYIAAALLAAGASFVLARKRRSLSK